MKSLRGPPVTKTDEPHVGRWKTPAGEKLGAPYRQCRPCLILMNKPSSETAIAVPGRGDLLKTEIEPQVSCCAVAMNCCVGSIAQLGGCKNATNTALQRCNYATTILRRCRRG